jgi:RNA polymerase sigma-70 factor (ECF subfamily)
MAERSTGDAQRSPVASLTRRLVKGEEDAYREFYDAYSSRLFGYLFVLCCGNADQARELLQQTMIRVAKYVRVFEQEEILWNWLATVARSCWVDETRKRHRYLAALERLWTWSRHDASPPDSADRDDIFQKALNALPEPERLLLTHKYIDELSVREIAALCGESEKAIESRLTRARHRIKQIILSRKDL